MVLQRDDGGGFTDVPGPSGWSGAVFDNSRYHMLTHYDPFPQQNGALLASRMHHWYVDFQAPLELPAGNYRLVVTGEHWDGAAQPYTVTSSPFAVTQGKSDELLATRSGDLLTVLWTHAPVPLESVETWPVAGYRLLDPEVAPDQPATVRAPLTLDFFVDGQPVGDAQQVEFTPGEGHVLDVAALGLPSDGLSVRAHLSADVIPAFVEAIVTAE